MKYKEKHFEINIKRTIVRLEDKVSYLLDKKQ